MLYSIKNGSVNMENLNKNVKKFTSRLFEVLAIFFTLCLLWLARSGQVNSFADGFFIALASSSNVFLSFLLYLITVLVFADSVVGLIGSLLLGVCITGCVVVSRRVRYRRISTICLIVGGVVRLGCAFLGQISAPLIMIETLNCAFMLMTAYVAQVALQGMYFKPRSFRPNDIELGCCAVLISLVCCGATAVNIYGFRPVYAIGLFAVMLVTSALGRGEGIFTAIAVGVGISLYTYDTVSIAFFAFIATVHALFSGALRPLALLSALLSAVLFEFYFSSGEGVLLKLFSLVVGGTLFCLLPKSFLQNVQTKFSRPSSKTCVRHLVNAGRTSASKRMEKVSNIFGEMASALGAIKGQGVLTVSQMASVLCDGVCKKCGKCDERLRRDEMEKLVSVTCEKGRASVGDLPFFLESDCTQTARLISVSAEMVRERENAKKRMSERDKLRSDLSTQMEGVKTILKRASEDMSLPVTHDGEREKLLVEELAYHGVIVCDALVTKATLDKITLVVSRGCAINEVITQVAGKVFSSSFSVESVSESSGEFEVVTLTENTPFDALFAVAGVSKNKNATGDTHSFIKISDTKFMMALCDGMGSGSEAGRVSETAIGLVESFYKAGFDSPFVIESVNRFLSFEEEESFVAFDILVCDLSTLERAVIKMGSPACYVLSSEGVAVLNGEALPMGALGEITPSVYADFAKEEQTVVFVSDGISDLFKGNELATFLQNHNSVNVQTLVDDVLAQAQKLNKGATADDMTVTAVRLIRRI